MERLPWQIVLAEDNPADVRLVRVALSEHAVQCDLRVILTASDAPADRQIAEENAALHFFRKPMSLTQFMHLGRIVNDVLTRPNTC
jgi:hypothetical protein